METFVGRILLEIVTRIAIAKVALRKMENITNRSVNCSKENEKYVKLLFGAYTVCMHAGPEQYSDKARNI